MGSAGLPDIATLMGVHRRRTLSTTDEMLEAAAPLTGETIAAPQGNATCPTNDECTLRGGVCVVSCQGYYPTVFVHSLEYRLAMGALTVLWAAGAIYVAYELSRKRKPCSTHLRYRCSLPRSLSPTPAPLHRRAPATRRRPYKVDATAPHSQRCCRTLVNIFVLVGCLASCVCCPPSPPSFRCGPADCPDRRPHALHRPRHQLAASSCLRGAVRARHPTPSTRRHSSYRGGVPLMQHVVPRR